MTHQSDVPIKYEYDHYAIHHQSATLPNPLDAATVSGPIVTKHQSQELTLSQQAEMKYSCSLDFARQTARGMHDIIGHNHGYPLPQGLGPAQRPQLRDKKQHKKSDDEHLSRDEKKARALNVSILR